jgi:hypothetical protein
VNKASAVWKHIQKLVHGTLPNRGKTQCDYVCMLCLSAQKPFVDCLINLANHNPSNGNTNLKHKHQLQLSNAAVSSKKIKLSAGYSAPSSSSVGLAVSPAYIAGANDAKIEAAHAQLVSVVVNKALPLPFAQDPDVTDLIMAASRIKPDSYVPPTRNKQDALLIQEYYGFVERVRHLVASARSMHIPANSISYQDVPWLTVHHDGWDGRLKNPLGVSCSFIVDWRLYRLSLGLIQPLSHASEDCSDAVLEVLSRFGVRKEDVLYAVNDTTNSSVKTGRLVSGQHGTCRMPVINLIIEHACWLLRC